MAAGGIGSAGGGGGSDGFDYRQTRQTPDWSENAVAGDHLWSSTSVSVDVCYVGDSDCVVSVWQCVLGRLSRFCSFKLINIQLQSIYLIIIIIFVRILNASYSHSNGGRRSVGGRAGSLNYYNSISLWKILLLFDRKFFDYPFHLIICFHDDLICAIRMFI